MRVYLTEEEFEPIADRIVASWPGTEDLRHEDVYLIWYNALCRFPAALIVDALNELDASFTGFLRPGVIGQQCREIRDRRLASVSMPAPPDGLTLEEYRRWEIAARHAIIAGETDRAAIEARGNATLQQLEGRRPIPLIEA